MDLWTLEFFVVSTGTVLGSVVFDGDLMTVDPGARGIVRDLTPVEVLERFDGWSNGYVSARRPGEKGRLAPGGGTKMLPVADADAALKDHVETTHFFDEESGELWEPLDVPEDPTPDDDAEAEVPRPG